MRRSRTQHGFALLAFVLALTVVAFSLVLGYSGTLTRRQTEALPTAQRTYLDGLQQALQQVYWLRATTAASGDVAQWRAFAPDEDVLALTHTAARWDVRAAVSEPLADAMGAPYQRIALWLPAETDAENPPDLELFRATGQWRACIRPTPCADTLVALVDGQPLQRALRAQAHARLARAAYKLQAYFKARTLQNPERNMAVNYFRNPRGGADCPSVPPAPDLGCLDTYRPIALDDPIAVRANLTGEDLASPWGESLEASNLQDSETQRPPFSMVLRVPLKGTADDLHVTALQPF
jgi:type II secretory pathway pseudopilin PulG